MLKNKKTFMPLWLHWMLGLKCRHPSNWWVHRDGNSYVCVGCLKGTRK